MASSSSIRIARFFLGITLGIVTSVLIGWIFDISFLKSCFSDTATMKVNTAILLGMLAGASLIDVSRPTRIRGLIVQILALSVIAIVLLTHVQNLFGTNFGIDELFMRDLGSVGTRWPPGRPSPVTLFNFLLIAISILAGRSSVPTYRNFAHGTLLVSWVLSFQAVVSHIEGVHATYGLALYTQMAVHTAFCFTLISSGLLFCRSEEGLMKIVSGDSESSRVARTLLFAAVAFPPTLAWVQTTGEKIGLWDAELGAIFRIITQVVFFSWIAFRTGASLRNAEEKQSVSQKKLHHAVRSRDDFLSIASHELRTPLTSMRLYSQLMARNIARGNLNVLAPERVNEFIEQTNRGLDRMNRLVEDMLDVSRIEGGRLSLNLEMTDLKSLLRQTLSRCALQMEKAKIDVSLVGDEVNASVDPFRMEQVFINLITNATRYAPGLPLSIEILPKDAAVQIRFSDKGKGIAPENLERVFERFERLVSANEVSGLGLGLYISRSIVEAHDGTIHIESRIGHGTTFVIDLPIRQAAW